MKTFQEWSSNGYQIIKGSKAEWIEGVAMFSEQQVKKSSPRKYGNHWKGASPKGTSPHWGDFEDFDEEDRMEADFYDVIHCGYGRG